MKLSLNDWKLSAYWPYAPLHGASVETGELHKSCTGLIRAKVPGSIYDDLYRAGIIPDPYTERNSMLCEWVPNRWWVYETDFVLEPSCRGKRIRLVFEGIDYHAHIYVNGRFICEHEGMYTPVTVEMGDFACFGEEKNTVRVLLHHAPDEMSAIGYTSRTFTQKARFTYKWDFCTRMIGMGLWGAVNVLVTEKPVLETLQTRYADGKLFVDVAASMAEGAVIEGELAFAGEVVAKHTGTLSRGGASFVLEISRPKLWYPNGYGEQPLYELKLTLKTAEGLFSDARTYQIGLRTLEYDRCDGAIDSALPYIPVINGKRIYIKGVNITPLDMMYGCVTEARYEALVRLCRDANVNLVRVWGGGIIEKEVFYDLCDRYGIMIWQEFIQSSSGIDNVPSKRPEFLKLAAETAEWAVPARRNHVSLTFWSGGNELRYADDTPSDYADENIAILKEIVDRLDPDRLMLPTSASGPIAWQDNSRPELNHDIHGPWKYAGSKGHYALYNDSPIQLHSEFGCDGMTNMPMLTRYLAPENRDRIHTVKTNLTWQHHGEWWDTYEYRDRPMFGEMNGDLETYVAVSQFMQAEGIRYALEAHRRRAWRNCGSIVWQMNEPWPNTSCTNLVDYDMQPKMAYWYYKKAMQSFHISLRYDSLVWSVGETFTAVPFVHDGEAEAKDALCSVIAEDDRGNILGEFSGAVSFVVPEGIRSFTLRCRAEKNGKTDENVYLYFVTREGEPDCSWEAVLAFLKRYPA